jgi:hypothetical protein
MAIMASKVSMSVDVMVLQIASAVIFSIGSPWVQRLSIASILRVFFYFCQLFATKKARAERPGRE